MVLDDVKSAISKSGNVIKEQTSKAQEQAIKIKDAVDPLKHLKSTILTPVLYLSIIALVVYFGLFLLHCWRFRQTRTKYHAVMAFSLLIACSGMITQLASHDYRVVAISLSINSLSNLIALGLTTFLIIRWGRSMKGFPSLLNSLIYPIGISWFCFFSFGSIIIGLAWALVINLLANDNYFIATIKFLLFMPLYWIGHWFIISGTSSLTSYSFMLFVRCPSHKTPGMQTKRKQALLLSVMFALLLGTNISMLLFVPYPSYCVMAVYYAITLFPQTALSSIGDEPCLVVTQQEMGSPSNSQSPRVTPEPASRYHKKSPPSNLRIMHLSNNNAATTRHNEPPSCVAGIRRTSPTVATGELESVVISDEH
ncbi:hypothetical protein BDF19DRAFT_421083 [Syncephalis fuscata]|nr:hypothetical protein BDF19DRAFT_421083 [Syncephalis fuscata]